MTSTSTNPAPTAVRRTLPGRIGLVLAGILAVAQIATGITQLDSPGPAIGLMVVAVVALVAIPFAWRGSFRAGVVVTVATVLAALTGLPAFFVSGVPAGAVVSAAGGIVASLVVAVLLVARPRGAR